VTVFFARVLRAAQKPTGEQMTYVIAEPCIGTKDASCVAVCPVDSIYEADEMFYINPDECIDCGACEPECPVQAIFPDSDLPAEWTEYLERNRELSGL
jgi:NAD-dependent dihydropyrimidine dehydrogenase PreA subunit